MFFLKGEFNLAKTILIDGHEYTASNRRMRYNPEFHFNQGKPWTMKDILYLCGMWNGQKARDIAFALGRTESTCMTKVYDLRKAGVFETYKKKFNQ